MSDTPRRRNVRLKDVAEKTGFSINTVSHALKDLPDISERTKEKIRAAAEELGYIGNASASVLRSGVSKTVAVIVGDISNPHFSILLKEIEAYLRRFGYISIVLNSDENPETERSDILAAIGKNVDGVILCPAPGGEANVAFLQKQGVPLVLMGRRLKKPDASYVICDDEGGGYLAAKHLLDKGYRDILFFNGARSISSAEERLRGYRAALRERGVPYRAELVHTIPITMGRGQDRIRRALRAAPDGAAIVAFSDMVAWEVIQTMRSTPGLEREPADIVGFDNIQSRFCFPHPLTSVACSKAAMATAAADILLERIRRPGLENAHVVLEARLVTRESALSRLRR